MFRKVRPKWYTETVAKKRNEDWSLEDRLLVYTLRVKERRPVAEVVEILHKMGKKADKISVYNLTRQSRKILLGKCYKCGSPLTKAEMKVKKAGKILLLCTTCKREVSELKKKRRQKFLKMGLCGVCGKKPHLPKHTSCNKCLSSVSRRRIMEGMCGTCGKRPINKSRSIHQCTVCLELNNLKIRLSA